MHNKKNKKNLLSSDGKHIVKSNRFLVLKTVLLIIFIKEKYKYFLLIVGFFSTIQCPDKNKEKIGSISELKVEKKNVYDNILIHICFSTNDIIVHHKSCGKDFGGFNMLHTHCER